MLFAKEATFSVLDYGADETGVRDSSEAFARIQSAVGTNRYSRIWVPPGKQAGKGEDAKWRAKGSDGHDR